MRAALSILGLVIVLAIVTVNMRKQANDLAASRAPATAASAASAPATALPDPQAIGRQVSEALSQAASRASDAQP